MPIRKNAIKVTTIFDGELDATDVFVSLIADKVREEKEKRIEYHENVIYNKDASYSTGSLGNGGVV